MENKARNVNDAFYRGVQVMLENGRETPSRNGPTLELEEPMLTIYDRPTEKVLFNPERDANPFLHFFEALWILAGRKDVDFLTQFAKNFSDYSDDGTTFHAAYGYRLKHQFQKDQLEEVIKHLKDSSESRRAVLQIWDAKLDLNVNSKDLPCNTTLYVLIRNNKLHLTTCCRSNDVIWGAYGANAVQFGTLIEYLAGRIGVEPGTFRQYSNSFHVYTDIPVWKKLTSDPALYAQKLTCYHATSEIAEWIDDPYTSGKVSPYPLMDNPPSFDRELEWFLADMKLEIREMFPNVRVFENSFFIKVAAPLWRSWMAYKEKNRGKALFHAQSCHASDWSANVIEWLLRRKSLSNNGSPLN